MLIRRPIKAALADWMMRRGRKMANEVGEEIARELSHPTLTTPPPTPSRPRTTARPVRKAPPKPPTMEVLSPETTHPTVYWSVAPTLEELVFPKMVILTNPMTGEQETKPLWKVLQDTQRLPRDPKLTSKWNPQTKEWEIHFSLTESPSTPEPTKDSEE